MAVVLKSHTPDHSFDQESHCRLDTAEFAHLTSFGTGRTPESEVSETALELAREEFFEGFTLVDHESTKPLAPAYWWALPDSSQHRIQSGC